MSDAAFRTLHALRIKGFAKVEAVAELADVPIDDAASHLHALAAHDHATYREARGLWQLTPAGRDEHARQLAADVDGAAIGVGFAQPYAEFLTINEAFKELCGEWQLRDGAVNDHADAAYDQRVLDKLAALDALAAPVVAAFGEQLPRFAPYAPRLARTCQLVLGGETQMFTGVMCGSYHDVWMELHEDLILSQGLDRAKEGSF